MAGAGTAGAPGRGRALVAFAAFGVFWGTWGGALPAIRAHAGVSEGELGVALLCIGVGALASMRLAGAVTDRLGAPVLPVTAVLLALAGVLPALATSPAVLGAAPSSSVSPRGRWTSPPTPRACAPRRRAGARS